jgi:hypothetical protein
MSSALAIAGVTAVLKDLLHNAVIDHDLVASVGSDVIVTALPPDLIKTEGPDAKSQLNIFLYQVTANAGWRNVGLPSRSGNGDRVTNPPLALDLHYLLTAYGVKDLHAEILLGYAMQLLHETPVLSREAIRKALDPSPINGGGGLPPTLEALATSELADQIEMIKITPETMNMEEVSRLWSAIQARYRPTAAYQASVVLIESRKRLRPTLPVRERRLHVVQLRRPRIEAITPQITLKGGALTITGQSLQGAITKLALGSTLVDPASVSDQQITVTAPASLFAGVNTLKVVHPLDLGTAVEPHGGFESNVVAFILAPEIKTPPPISAARGATLTLAIDPPVGRAQRVALLVGDRTITIPPRPSSGPETATDLDFPIPADFPTGTFLLRAQVDGADSPLGVNIMTGEYDNPKVTIT